MFSYFVYGPQCLLYFIFDTFDIPISCIYTDIPLYSFILLHRLDFHVSLAFNASVFTLFYLHCISQFLPLWLELFHMFVHSHVCIYYSPLFTCVIDQTGCRRENGTEPVIASARCLTARSYRRFLGFLPEEETTIIYHSTRSTTFDRFYAMPRQLYAW